MSLRRQSIPGRRGGPALVSGMVALLVASMGCNSNTEVATGVITTGPVVSTLTFTLDPASVTLSPGGQALTIGTVRGVSGLTLTFTVDQLPNGVSVRVTSNTDGTDVTTKKVIVFADAATVPGTYGANIRLAATNHPDTVVPLTVIVAGVR